MANNYLLLRNNKQSGPYTVADLRNLGLKAYDLVWVQEKSAAWRYPGEIEELKEFSPPVEEQPFDRFFKKNKEEKKVAETVIQHEDFVPKKSVFVTMPGQKNSVVRATVSESADESKTIIIKENPVAAQARFIEPVEEIKEMYAKTLQQRKQKIARKNSLVKNLKKASVFIYMIALGVLIGLTIKTKSGKKNIAEPPQTNITSEIKQAPVQTTPEITNQPITKTEANEEKTISSPQTVKPVIQNPETEKKKIGSTEKESGLTANKEIDPTQVSPGVDINSTTGERNKKSRTETGIDNNQEKTGTKDDISKYVSVKGSDYKRGAFGGIRDLQLTVNNTSKYILDNVIVELQYLKPSEQPLKSENVEFKSIAPNGSLTIAIPPSNRGIGVIYKIIKIESKELDNATAGL